MFELATQFARCYNDTSEAQSNVLPSDAVITFFTFVHPVVAIIGIVAGRYRLVMSSISLCSQILFVIFSSLLSVSRVFIAGNIFVIVLMNATPKETACIFYLRCLAVFDCISITAFQCSFYPLMVLKLYLTSHFGPTFKAIDLYFSKPGVCQITVFLSFTSRTLSTWTVVMFTVERLIVVAWPLRAIKFFTLRRTRCHILITVVASVLINMPWLFALETVRDPCGTGEFVCRPNEVLNVNRIFEVLFLSVLPSTIICTCNTVILHKIRNHRRPGSIEVLYADSDTGACTNNNHSNSPSAYNPTRFSTTMQLLVVSFCFLGLTLPSAVINVIQTFNHFLGTWKDCPGPLADTYYIAWFLFMINLSSNFFVYCLVRRTFRKAALGLFRRKKSASPQREWVSQPRTLQLDQAPRFVHTTIPHSQTEFSS